MAKNNPTKHPYWALAHKRPGTELRLIKGRYYLYEYKTIYDKDKKKPKKVSGQLLGSITEKEGFIPSPKKSLKEGILEKGISNLLCKEYGVSQLTVNKFSAFNEKLQAVFPDNWKEILAIAYCRFVYRCPLKSVPFRIASSFLPELLNLKSFNEKTTSGILNQIGNNREKVIEYLKLFISPGEFVLMDATDIFSASHQIDLARKGYNSKLQYDTQFNLMYIYSSQNKMPVYYRLLPGNIRDVKAFKNCLIEAGLKDAIVVADKGFYSKANVELLLSEKLKFILPLKRDSSLISYEEIASNTFKTGSSFFEHENRPIWHNVFPQENKLKLYLFLDEQLRIREDADYLRRIKTHPESYSIEGYHNKKNRFGTIALLSPIEDKPDVIYETYKTRNSIEVMFDSMKNVMEADHTYMQNEQTLQGWMFINHITLQWYQQLYIELKEKSLLKKISVNDYIQTLTDVKKIKINNQWHFNEFTTQTEKLISKLGIKIS